MFLDFRHVGFRFGVGLCCDARREKCGELCTGFFGTLGMLVSSGVVLSCVVLCWNLYEVCSGVLFGRAW